MEKSKWAILPLAIALLACGCKREIPVAQEPEIPIPKSIEALTPIAVQTAPGAFRFFRDVQMYDGLFLENYYDADPAGLKFDHATYYIEVDTGNRFDHPIYYMGVKAIDQVSNASMVLRLELEHAGNTLYLRNAERNVLHIHTCVSKIAGCEPMVDPVAHVYLGCRVNGVVTVGCGGSESIRGGDPAN